MLRCRAGIEICKAVKIGDDLAQWYVSPFEGIDLEDNVGVYSRVKVIRRKGVLRVGRRTIFGTDAVVLESIEEREICAGTPARESGNRPPENQVGRRS